jgi:hypothetical protein
MNDNDQSRKNCLQWGLRILSPKTYFALLRRYTIELSPDAYDQIKEAHMNKRGGPWRWQWLSCEILETGKWINIATGRGIANWHYDKAATFPSWAAYEGFREELREAVSKWLSDDPMLFL